MFKNRENRASTMLRVWECPGFASIRFSVALLNDIYPLPFTTYKQIQPSGSFSSQFSFSLLQSLLPKYEYVSQ